MAFIYKDGSYYNMSGSGGASLPAGGTTGQALLKHSNTDQDVEWGDVDGLPSGGTQGQVLTKQSSTDGDADWENPTEYTAGDGINIDENGEISTDNMPASDMAEVASPMPSVMSRRFKYSLEEQVVGEWIDGKPVYQLVIVRNTFLSVSGSYVKFGDLPANVDTMVFASINRAGIGPVNTSIQSRFLNNNLDVIYTLSGSIDLWVGSFAVLQYTKTTD